MKKFSTRRPSRAACPACGEPMYLIDCGVREHRRTRTRREQIDGRCTGLVYAHIQITDCGAGPFDRID